MSGHKQQHPAPQVTLEQLIQLKRTEKPSADYWEHFEKELHRRQLATVVTVEPWHKRLSRAFIIATRRLAPIGATAAAIAGAFIALNRTPEAIPTEMAAAETEAEARITMLPEEHVTALVAQDASTPASRLPKPAAIDGHLRYATQELASVRSSAKRYVTIASPVTFSTTGDTSAVYAVNAMTAGMSFGSAPASLPESL